MPAKQKFFKQVVSAVTALQQRNVLHRDIKDENILVNLKTNSCILIDFGSGCHTKQVDLHQPGAVADRCAGPAAGVRGDPAVRPARVAAAGAVPRGAGHCLQVGRRETIPQNFK